MDTGIGASFVVHVRSQVTVGEYRPVAYAYITGPPPELSCRLGEARQPKPSVRDGPRGERDLRCGRITLPRGADLGKLRAADTLRPFADFSDNSLTLTIPKAPTTAREGSEAPGGEYVDPDETGLKRLQRKFASRP